MKLLNMFILTSALLFSVACKQETEEKINEIIANYQDPTELIPLAEEIEESNKCPDGMLSITQNDGHSFCVDKNISDKKVNLYDAYNACKNRNVNKESSSYYALISNEEWMLIAREIELNENNWSSEKIGRGNIRNQQLILMTGEVISDFNNSPQWIDWIRTKGLDYYPGGCGSNDSKDGWVQFNQENKLCEGFSSTFGVDEIFPLYPHSSMGKIRILEKHHSGIFDNQGALRGASLDGSVKGIYTLDLGVYTFSEANYRCVYRF